MQIYNTMTRKKEEFTPVHPGIVNIYVCGITAYDYCHIGHARSSVVFDLLVRYLRSCGYKVTFVRNFTDVDDKIIVRANQDGVSSQEIAEKYIKAFHEDMDKLNVLRPDFEPKATEHIQEMIDICSQLIEQGHAYATASGDVYFRVDSFAEYGKLSGRSLDDMLSGARVAPGEEKENPMDFALWKAAKPEEPYWESPWGRGRPGWHIECSAMSEKYMPLPLDIHGGGQDLVFPHHENEIAQTEAARKQDFCKYWVHNGFVQIDSEKMSKSLGNFKTIRDILEAYLPEVLRFFLLTRQYRNPIDFTFDTMNDAEKNLKRIYQQLESIQLFLKNAQWGQEVNVENFQAEIDEIAKSFADSMADDLNSAAALGHINNITHLAGRIMEDKSLSKSSSGRDLIQSIQKHIATWGEILGLFQQQPEKFLAELLAIKVKRNNIDVARIENLITERQTARKNKDFQKADAIRAELTEIGVEMRDTAEGAIWDLS